jgi:hypothetical protein
MSVQGNWSFSSLLVELNISFICLPWLSPNVLWYGSLYVRVGLSRTWLACVPYKPGLSRTWLAACLIMPRREIGFLLRGVIPRRAAARETQVSVTGSSWICVGV